MTYECEGRDKCDCCGENKRCKKPARYVATSQEVYHYNKYFCDEHREKEKSSMMYRDRGYTWWVLLEC